MAVSAKEQIMMIFIESLPQMCPTHYHAWMPSAYLAVDGDLAYSWRLRAEGEELSSLCYRMIPPE